MSGEELLSTESEVSQVDQQGGVSTLQASEYKPEMIAEAKYAAGEW